jgi:hypothetical protein
MNKNRENTPSQQYHDQNIPQHILSRKHPKHKHKNKQPLHSKKKTPKRTTLALISLAQMTPQLEGKLANT